MQIVMEIDDDVYKRALVYKGERLTSSIANDLSELITAVANGTPLPKGHGRLIDADKLWDAYHSNDYDFYEAIDDIPTIVEADKEESEEISDQNLKMWEEIFAEERRREERK